MSSFKTIFSSFRSTSSLAFHPDTHKVASGLKGVQGLRLLVGGGGLRGWHCVLNLGFTRTFSGNQDAMVKKKFEVIFIRFGIYRSPFESKRCLEISKATNRCLKLNFNLGFTHCIDRIISVKQTGLLLARVV